MKFKKFISCALVLSMLTSALPLASVPAGAADTTLTPSNTSGTLTITLKIKGTPEAPEAPTKSDATKNSVTLTAVDGCEYSKDGETWQDSTEFTGLTPGTEYSFYQRKKADEDNNASPASPAAKISTLPDTFALTITLVIAEKFTVTYDANGGDGTAPADDTEYAGNDTVTVKSEGSLTKDGYSFDGWNTEADGSGTAYAANGTFTITADTTLYAQWAANQHTITFDTDGGSAVAAITQDYGTAVTAPADPTKTGYTFAGWDKEIPETMPAESMTITAQWTVNRYTMTFDDNGSHSEYVLDYGTNLTDYIPDIQWEGHTFMGWNPEVPETVPAEDMTFTAVWDTNVYTITFDSNGGSYVAPIVQDYGTKVIAPMNPMREGYAFIGWDTAIPETMPAEDMTVRALWVTTPTIGAPRISSGAARVPSGTAQPEVTVSSTDEITPKMWAVLNDDNSVTVSWDKIKNASSYILYVEKNGKAVKLTETKGTEVTLKKAKNGVTYKFSLKYTRNGSTFSAPKGYKANLRVYYKPAVTAVVTKDGKILLKWNKVANADKYVIYRVNASGKLVKAGTTTKTAAKIAAKSTDTGYVVRAYVNGNMTPVAKSDIVTAE
ncbi:MAG: InlB B-repeat-containing protein [Oscillospiraceae bacterium]|nr:InlB B-repeat-containing protein [Oscillospiraceae bacterium]